MELRHLKYFVAVAEELHFGRAARRLHIAQPPLSQQIRQLEEELGEALFFRNNHRVELTAAGEAMLPHARQVLALAGESADIVMKSARGESGTISVGYVDEAVHTVFPGILEAFHRMYPAVHFRLRETHSNDQLNQLEAGSLDIGIGYSPAHVKCLNSVPILEGRVMLAVPAGHPLANKKLIHLSKCKEESFIFPVRESSPRLHDFFLSICDENGLIPDINYTAEHIYTVMGLVRSGLGITLYPEFLGKDMWPGVVVRPIAGRRQELQMYATWNVERQQSKLQRNFQDLLLNTFCVRKPREK